MRQEVRGGGGSNYPVVAAGGQRSKLVADRRDPGRKLKERWAVRAPLEGCRCCSATAAAAAALLPLLLLLLVEWGQLQQGRRDEGKGGGGCA